MTVTVAVCRGGTTSQTERIGTTTIQKVNIEFLYIIKNHCFVVVVAVVAVVVVIVVVVASLKLLKSKKQAICREQDRQLD